MSHTHSFSEIDWPFELPVNTASFTTVRVLDGSHPIREVYHGHDGEWQFMCGTTNATEDARLECMGCMFERDPSLRQVANLPRGWVAYRESPTEAWSQDAYEDTDTSDDQ
jgi:hypothetical protein